MKTLAAVAAAGSSLVSRCKIEWSSSPETFSGKEPFAMSSTEPFVHEVGERMPSKYGLFYSWSIASEVIHFKTKTINCYLFLQNDVLMLTLGCWCGLLRFIYLNLTAY